MANSNNDLNSKTSDSTDISKPWDKDNQAWWDWYVSLADNDFKENEIINVDPLPDIEIPSDDKVVSELAEPYNLTNDQIVFFKKNGFLKTLQPLMHFLHVFSFAHRESLLLVMSTNNQLDWEQPQ